MRCLMSHLYRCTDAEQLATEVTETLALELLSDHYSEKPCQVLHIELPKISAHFCICKMRMMMISLSSARGDLKIC